MSYIDQAHGVMVTHTNGGAFSKVVLRPVITISREQDIDKARQLHHDAHEKCFIANSVNFPIDVEPDIRVAAAQ